MERIFCKFVLVVSKYLRNLDKSIPKVKGAELLSI